MALALIASIERAGDHVLVVGVLAVIAIVAGLVYGLVQVLGKRRAGGPRSDRGPGRAEGPET